MRLLLDTSYFLPLVGISVREITGDSLLRLLRANHKLCISEITLFELAAKGAKYVRAGKLEASRVSDGVRALVYDDRVEKVRIYSSEILHFALKLRELLEDFIDCLIVSTAVNVCDALVTEDELIREFSESRDFRALSEKVNPNFEVCRLADVL